MNINHEMSYSDKLKEIKRTTNATQKDLAMKLGVSSKTMSFWLNGKDIPSVRHEKTIQELYCKVVDAVKQKTDARKAVEEYDARHDDGAESLRKGISDAEYYEGKSYAISQEKGNTSKIYLLRVRPRMIGIGRVGGRWCFIKLWWRRGWDVRLR